jgi:uncharacterized protein DUF6932
MTQSNSALGVDRLPVRYGATGMRRVPSTFVLPALDPVTGLLPAGRHVCTQGEVESAFVSASVFSSSVTRAVIWSDWQNALSVLQSAALVRAAWIGGSFTTAKVDPEDIDVTFIIDAADMRRRSPQDQKIIALFAGGGQVKANLKLRVDAYIVAWECLPQPARAGLNPLQDGYYWTRGHWDDWWQRARVSAKGTPPAPADAIPRRGYVEVLVSDYT